MTEKPGTLWLDEAGLEVAARGFSGGAFNIAMVHGGEEWNARPFPEQKRLYRELIRAGADVVIGSHPHVLQGMEAFHGGLIVYSLGNFLFPGMEGTGGGQDSAILKIGVVDGKAPLPPPIPRAARRDLGSSRPTGAVLRTMHDTDSCAGRRRLSRARGDISRRRMCSINGAGRRNHEIPVKRVAFGCVLAGALALTSCATTNNLCHVPVRRDHGSHRKWKSRRRPGGYPL